MQREKIFISYSHKDSRWVERLKEHLSVAQHEDLLEIFDDSMLSPGEDWCDRLHREMDSARIALLLISASFLTSKFVRDEEVPKLFARHEQGGLQLYPLLVRDCPWESV